MVNLKLAVLTLSALTLSACVVAPYPRYRQAYVAQPVAVDPQNEVLAETDVAPPPPQVEVIPVAPFVGAVWIGGYWGWQGGRHVWYGGRWEHPRAGYIWHPHAWVAVGGHWRLRAGYWGRGR
jgi:hypothetical protein